MKKNSVKSLKLSKKTISSLSKRGVDNHAIKGGRTQHPCIDNLGKPSFHCGTLSCESFACPTADWTMTDCNVLLG